MSAESAKLRVGVVGCGLLGQRHARFWAQQDDAELVGVADARIERAEDVATQWSVPRACRSVEELMDSVRPDAVSVATPDFAHREPVLIALAAGADVLVEKPLAMSSADARAVIDAAAQARRVLMVNHSMRWIPRFASVKQSIANGELGELLAAHSFKADRIYVPTQMLTWASQSSPAYFLTAHDLDLVRWFADDEVAEVYAQGTRRILVARGIDTFDVVQASVRFAGGALATFEASWVHPNTYPSFTDDYMHLIGSQGVVYLDRGRETMEIFDEQTVSHPKLSTVYEHEGRIYGSFRHALEHFMTCVRSRAEPLTSGARVFGVVAALEAIHQSLATGRPVALALRPSVSVPRA